MNLKEAYSILEIPQTATPDEAKKRYRNLTKKFHPDINKEPDAEEKFKKINEAYQVVSTGKSTDKPVAANPWGNGGPFRSSVPFGSSSPFGKQVNHPAENINLYTTLSFKDSIQGCKRELKFKRKARCKSCHGEGSISLNNGCVKCGGSGQTTIRRNNMVFIQGCDKCFGRTQTEDCKACNGEGVVEAEASISVSIPGGVHNDSVLRLNNMGHFMGSFGPLEQHTDAHLHISVTPEEGLSLDGNHVIFTLEISLLDAIRGCNKSVKTVLGDKEVEIKPMSRNKEEVIIPNVGVNGTGDQRVILDVKYPQEINKLVETLTEAGVS
jgi:molecular chaperone DnaJ